MLLPTLVRWLSRWVSYLLFLPSFQRFPKQKWTLYLALALDMKRCPHWAGLSLAILDSILALSLGLYISSLFIPLTVAISQIYSIAAGPQSPGRAVTGATVRLCPLLPPPAAAAPPLPDFSSLIGGIIEELHNILDTQKYISNKHISKC